MSGIRASDLPDLAVDAIGGAAVIANDEFFGGKENLVRVAAPIWEEGRYTDRGKWMDGWETRRRREPGHDWCIVRLGVAGVLRQAVIDTSYFTGNYPPRASLEGTHVASDASLEELLGAEWIELLPLADLQGDHRNVFDLTEEVAVSHVRLAIHPDGGVARLRLHGEAVPDWPDIAAAGQVVDLVNVLHGGRVRDASDRFYSDPGHLLRPGPSRGMHDGWETQRRRDDGNDWVELGLGAPGRIQEAVVDTSHFKGNAPGACRLRGRRGGGAWTDLVPRTDLEPDHEQRLQIDSSETVDEVRLDIYPDGGLARVRLLGTVDPTVLAELGLRRLNLLPEPAATTALLSCCGSTRWAARVALQRPYPAVEAVHAAADDAFGELDREDVLEAFDAHPRIGERTARTDTGARSRRWSSGEQSGVRDDDRARLEAVNRAYEQRFGWLFLICATGLDSGTILARAEERLDNDPETEFAVATEEQRKITHLRLAKLLGEAT